MVKKQKGTNKQYKKNFPSETKRTENIMVSFTPLEIDFIKSFTKLFSHMVDPITGKPIITENSPVALIRFCISAITAIYQTQVFPDSRIINMFSNKDTKEEFIASREKYKNQPSDLQRQELKRLGLVKQITNKTVS